MSKKKWNKVALIPLLIASFICILILWSHKGWNVAFEIDDGGYFPERDIDDMLLHLGKESLGLINHRDRHQPRDFRRFEFMQHIRAAGFEPLWKGDRYILRDLKSGRTSDPFRLRPDKKFSGVSEIVLGRRERDLILNPGSSHFPNTTDIILSEIYSHQVMGFHLVARDKEFMYVRNVLPTDMEITFEQLFLRDTVVSYNAYALQVNLCYVERNEEILNKRRGPFPNFPQGRSLFQMHGRS
jgi:hypothetical protein